ncbi:hypothetical protein [Streptomyces sp. NPDC002526]
MRTRFTMLQRLGTAAVLSLALTQVSVGGAGEAAAAQSPNTEAGQTARMPAPQLVLGPLSEEGEPSVATCPSGTKPVNGGFVSEDFRYAVGGSIYDAITANAPTGDGKGWGAMQLKGRVQARALCAPQDQAPQVVVGPVSEEGEPSVATCPSGTKPVNGGYVSTDFRRAYGGTIYDAITANAPTGDGKGWGAMQLKGRVQARALCAPQDQAPQLVVGPVSEEGEHSVATCPSGTKPVNGGYVSTDFRHAYGGTIYDAIMTNAPTGDGRGWDAKQLKGRVQARALCAPQDQAPQLVVGPVSEDGQPSIATCPAGTKPLNGGFLTTSFHHAYGGEIYDFVTANAPTSNGTGWGAIQLKGKVQAHALCVHAD